MAKRKRKMLGLPRAEHTIEAGKASRAIENAAVLTVNKARNGKCAAATMAYADMQREIGRYEAHMQSGGSRVAAPVYKPTTAIRDAAYEYNQHCVRESRDALAGRRRRRSR